MARYTREDAKYVLRYYADKIIGRMPESSQYPVVDMLFLEERDTNQYEIYGSGLLAETERYPKVMLESLARNMGLPMPAEILNHRNF